MFTLFFVLKHLSKITRSLLPFIANFILISQRAVNIYIPRCDHI